MTNQASMVYAGVFLTGMAQQKLLRAFQPVHPQVHAHHQTIWHVQAGGDVPELPWGQTVDLKVLGHFRNADAQAVVVRPPTKLRPGSRTPHITVSTAEGVKPVASNTLIPSLEDLLPVKGLPSIRGVVGWVDETGTVHFEAPQGSTATPRA